MRLVIWTVHHATGLCASSFHYTYPLKQHVDKTARLQWQGPPRMMLLTPHQCGVIQLLGNKDTNRPLHNFTKSSARGHIYRQQQQNLTHAMRPLFFFARDSWSLHSMVHLCSMSECRSNTCPSAGNLTAYMACTATATPISNQGNGANGQGTHNAACWMKDPTTNPNPRTSGHKHNQSPAHLRSQEAETHTKPRMVIGGVPGRGCAWPSNQ